LRQGRSADWQTARDNEKLSACKRLEEARARENALDFAESITLRARAAETQSVEIS